MATGKRRRKRRNKKNKRKLLLLGGVVVMLLAIVAVAKFMDNGQRKLAAESHETGENASDEREMSLDEVKNDEVNKPAQENDEPADVEAEKPSETEKPSEPATAEEPDALQKENAAEGEDAAGGEDAAPEEGNGANPVNADGMTWTSFDGMTMGSIKGGVYGSLYTAEQIAALDGTKQGYGQGVNVDDNNRPVGAIWLQEDYGKYGAVYIAENSDQIYMTLDEGYENGYTSVILDKLKEKNCSAVFFVTMDYVKKNPELVKRMINEGHVVGNHSVNHKSMPTLSLEEASAEITELHQYVLDNFGYEMYLFRPPMGEFSEQTLALAQSLGYRTMLWSYAYRDYDTQNQPDVTEALSKVTAAKHGGAVYLLHAVSSANAAIMGDVIDDFRNSGYTVGAFPR